MKGKERRELAHQRRLEDRARAAEALRTPPADEEEPDDRQQRLESLAKELLETDAIRPGGPIWHLPGECDSERVLGFMAAYAPPCPEYAEGMQT